MFRKAYLVVSVFILFFIFPLKIFAASITLQSNTTMLNSSSDIYETTVTVSINATNGTVYYLRGVFYKPNTSSYCGYTWNGNDWFSGPYSTNEGWRKFFPITITNGEWIGTLKTKIDGLSNACNTSGDYQFKVERFTVGGSGNFDDQNILTLSVVVPTLTPTPSTILTPTRTSTPTKVPTPTKGPTPTKIPTPTKTPTVIPTNIAIPQATKTITKVTHAVFPTQLVNKNASNSVVPTAILGASISAIPTSKKNKVWIKASSESNPFGGWFVLMGGLLLVACGILVFLRRIRRSNE